MPNRGYRWDVRLEFVRQFKTDYVRRLEGVDYVRLIRISTFYVLKKSLKMKKELKNDLFLNCRTKPNELSNIPPALLIETNHNFDSFLQ
jgi:hypothetical protein